MDEDDWGPVMAGLVVRIRQAGEELARVRLKLVEEQSGTQFQPPLPAAGLRARRLMLARSMSIGAKVKEALAETLDPDVPDTVALELVVEQLRTLEHLADEAVIMAMELAREDP